MVLETTILVWGNLQLNDTVSGENIIGDELPASGGVNELDGGPGNDRLNIIDSGAWPTNVESFSLSTRFTSP